MFVTLTNNTDTPVPVMSKDENGWAYMLLPNEPYTFDKPETKTVIIGEKPGFLASIRETLRDFVTMVMQLLEAWKGKKDDEQAENGQEPTSKPSGTSGMIVAVTVMNESKTDLRVVEGGLVHATDLQPGDSLAAEAFSYVELRELMDEDE
jgi:hypothetical protein